MTSPRRKFLAEMSRHQSTFAELAEALQPIEGENEAITVSVRVLRRLMNFVGEGIADMRAIAKYIPDDVIDDRAALHAPMDAIDNTYYLLESHSRAEQNVTKLATKDDVAGALILYEFFSDSQKLAWEIARNQPTTIGGVIAVLKYVACIEASEQLPPDYQKWLAQLHASLAKSLEQFNQ